MLSVTQEETDLIIDALLNEVERLQARARKFKASGIDDDIETTRLVTATGLLDRLLPRPA